MHGTTVKKVIFTKQHNGNIKLHMCI